MAMSMFVIILTPQSPWEEVKKEMVEEKGLSEEAADRYYQLASCQCHTVASCQYHTVASCHYHIVASCHLHTVAS